MNKIELGRIARNIRAGVMYPVWAISGRPPPDNHYYKIARIKSLASYYKCDTFIESGTFYGQTLASVTPAFKKLLSVELSHHFFEENKNSFADCPKIRLFEGDSQARLAEMIDSATGRILYWLDGHFSGGKTALGESVTPALSELEIIFRKGRTEDCILIDDARLFKEQKEDYPGIDQILALLKRINAQYKVEFDRDCIIAHI